MAEGTQFNKLARPLTAADVKWRRDSKVQPSSKQAGKYAARFVPYIEAGLVRARLDESFLGDWCLSLEVVPHREIVDSHGEVQAQVIAVVATLQVGKQYRSDIGQGRDYKQASTDAFKRAAVRFGIAAELYDDERWHKVWGLCDDRGNLLEDLSARIAGETPAAPSAYPKVQARIDAHDQAVEVLDLEEIEPVVAAIPPRVVAPARQTQESGQDGGQVLEERDCPKCGGEMWDNRATKFNPKAPDFKCKDKTCEGVIWPERDTPRKAKPRAKAKASAPFGGLGQMDEPDELPF